MGHINPGPSSNDNKSNKGHLFPRGNDVPNLISVQKKIIGTSKQYLELSNDYAPQPPPHPVFQRWQEQQVNKYRSVALKVRTLCIQAINTVLT